MLITGKNIFLDGIIIFFLSIFIIQLIKLNAKRFNLLDIPNKRSSHLNPTPRGAGIAIFLSFIIVTILFHFEFFIQYIGFFIASTIVFILGVYDDIKNSSAKLKLIIIAFATLIMFIVNDFEIKTLGNWFGYDLNMPYLISLFFTMFAVAGFTNALNLIDGLDGLAGTISFIILSALFYIGYIYNDQFILLVTFFMLMAILAFLIFNWYPASIFMGDSGSLTLGFIIAALAIKATNYISDTAILFIVAIPIIDTIIVMTRRIQRGVSPFSPDKTHLHHKMVDLKKSVDRSVHILVALQIILSSIGILLRDKSDFINMILFSIILFVFFQALDSKSDAQGTLLVSKVKAIYLEKIKIFSHCKTIYITIGIIVLLIVIKLFFE